MSKPDTEQEPSIEEILTSIRQIISDDDDEAQEEPAPEPEPEPADDAIELTERLDEPEPEPDPEPEPEPEEELIEVEMHDSPPPPPRPKPREDDFDSVLTNHAENAAFDAFSELARKTAVEHGGITLEEIVRGELKPMLRDWLDKNLPHIIERLVQEELERVAKRAMEE